VRFEFNEVGTWPPNAWLAKCESGNNRVIVLHGSGVEVCDEFFSEAVWAGPYSAGDFDRTDIVAGSGGRLRADEVTFVGSGNPVDRLNSYTNDKTAWISNSLACLLTGIDAAVDIIYPYYYEDFYSIAQGLKKYKRTVHTSRGNVTLTYFDNLHWDGRSLVRKPKPLVQQDFGSFDGYMGFLRSALSAFTLNMATDERRAPYTTLATTSSGYDSPTVTALLAEVGCNETLCFDQSHQGENDSGEEIAKILKVAPRKILLAGWRTMPTPEPAFLAGNAIGEELRFKSAELVLRDRVLFTGYLGDKMWGLNADENLSPDYVRTDCAGSGFTEYRLWARFIHCPLPCWGGRQVADIRKISEQPELNPWRVNNDYDRPIPRRILVEKGVPRELFGIRKRNSSSILHNHANYLTPASMQEFLQWLRQHQSEWFKRLKMPPLRGDTIDQLTFHAANRLVDWGKTMPVIWKFANRLESRPMGIRRYVFPWAMSVAQRRYAGAPRI
jgi:hypothetical protein